MPKLNSLLHLLTKKVVSKRMLYLEISCALLAFALMLIATFFFMSTSVKKQLRDNAEIVLSRAQEKIESDLREPETTLSSFSLTIRRFILDGMDLPRLRSFVHEYTNYLNESKKRMSSFDGVYGYFTTLNGDSAFIDGNGWAPPIGYVPQARPWFVGALAGQGALVKTAPYRDMTTGLMVFTFASAVYDDSGRLIAVVCLNVPWDAIGKNIIQLAMSQGGYGMLLDSDMTVLVHPLPGFVGKSAAGLPTSLAAVASDLEKEKEVIEYPLNSFRGEPSIAFFRKISSDWHLGLVTPKEPYYQSVTRMAWTLFCLSLAFSAAVIYILVRIENSRGRLDFESRQKSVFLAHISHQIRTPMNTIIGIAEIQQANTALHPDAIEAMDKIYGSANILMGIINDLLDLSKIETGRLQIMSSQYDIASLINDTVHLHMLRFESSPLEFNLKVSEDIPAIMFGDELRIKQILNNLLSNAAKYTKKGEVELSVSADLELSAHGDTAATLVLSVRDTGPGMTAAQVDDLFDEYSRFNIKTGRTTEGTGLGMGITRDLIRLMNGHLAVDSKPGKGTLFTVRLPQGVAGGGKIGHAVAEGLRRFHVNAGLYMKKARIVREYMPYGSVLVVDDVQSNLYVAKGLMQPYGLHIETTISGLAAIKKIMGGKVYDIIFMDHMMPDMDGMEAVKHIRRLDYTGSIVALTANAMTGQAEIFLANGFDAFLSKPIDIRQLDTLLNHLIRDKQPPEVIKAARHQQFAHQNNSASEAMPQQYGAEKNHGAGY
jgi:signal transduction histidine kinase/CheY-like chemotaxis protein